MTRLVSSTFFFHGLRLLAIIPLLEVQAINKVWRDFDLPDNNEMMEMMATYQMREYYDGQARGRSLYAGKGAKMGERCGSRTTCSQEEQDLQCTRAVFGNRCLPKTCLQKGIEKFQSNFDMEEYKQTILQDAGITESDLQQGFGKLADEESTETERIQLFQTPLFQSLKHAIDQNGAPADAFFEMYDQCTTGVQNNETTPSSSSPLDLQRVNYVGVHFEGGFFLDGELSFIWERSTNNAYVRYCIGAGAIGGAHVSFLYLISQFTNETDAITQTCTVRGQVTFGLPLNFAVGYGYGFANDIRILELAAGAGLSFHAGISFCGASKI